MVWFKVDDRLYDHLKVTSIPRRRRLPAMGMWVLAGSWAASHLTDGRVPADVVDDLGPRQAADDLVTAGLWISVNGYYEFHSWSEWQLTKGEVEAARAGARDRARKWRENHPRHKPP